MAIPLITDSKIESTSAYIGYNRWQVKDTKIPNPNARGKRVKKVVITSKSDKSSVSTISKAADAFDSDNDSGNESGNESDNDSDNESGNDSCGDNDLDDNDLDWVDGLSILDNSNENKNVFVNNLIKPCE